MKSAAKYALVCVTAPDVKTARMLARAALEARLIACANLIPKVESHYWWQGKVESGAEVLMLMKAPRTRLAALEKLIVAKHPYDTPEFLALPLGAGNRKYLDWLADACASPDISQQRGKRRHRATSEFVFNRPCPITGSTLQPGKISTAPRLDR